MKNIISIYGGHDASVTFIDKNNRVRVIEVERFSKKRYSALSSFFDNRSFGITDDCRERFFKYVYDNVHDPEKIEKIIYMNMDNKDIPAFRKFFPDVSFYLCNHHFSHAYCGHYQSTFEKSMIFSIDGGGIDDWKHQDDGTIQGSTGTSYLFLGDKDDIKKVEMWPIDLGNSYQNIGRYISEIKKKKNDDGLSWSGKLMGLCAYGNVREEWIPILTEWYRTHSFLTHEDKFINDISSSGKLWIKFIKDLFPNEDLVPDYLKDRFLNVSKWYNENHEVSDSNPIPDNFTDCFEGQESYDLAATNQRVFEGLAFGWMKPLIDEHKRDVVLVGGCALNVLYNQKLSEYLFDTHMKKLHIPPNPNDCGLSLGFFLEEGKNQGQSLRGEDFVYDGIELLDREDLQSHVKERNAKKVSTKKIVDIIKQGKIVGLVYGDSEIGPRALGNRSIICDPSFANMKDILNKKVKFREWFRPFAPVCMLNESNKYFHRVFESNYMSFAPKVKREYQDRLRSITHVDETSRLQTISKVNGHKVFTEILEELKSRNEIPVILNTSFNIRGFPILTTIEDALHVLDNTELDHVVIEGYLFSK